MELDFPNIEAPAAAPGTAITELLSAEPDLKTVELKDVALAQFGAWRADVATTRATLTGLVLDLSTGKGLADARSLRQRLINAPLAEARKISTAVKSKLTAVGRDVGAELELIEAAYMGTETAKGLVDLITPQIEAREAEIAAEKEAARLKEEARVQKHRDALAALARPAERAADPSMTAERIANGIELVKAVAIDRAAWEEFADRAEEQKAVTLERMQALHDAAVAREAEAARAAAEAARLQAEREEAERVAAAQQAEAARLAALAAELERERAAIQAEKDRATAEAQAKADEAARLEREQREEAERQARELQEARERAEAAEARAAAEADEAERLARRQDLIERGREIVNDIIAAEVLGDAVANAAPAPFTKPAITIEIEEAEPFVPEQVEAPTLSLGTINTRLGLTVTSDLLAALGFEFTRERASKLYRESDFDAICAGISAHVLAIAAAHKVLA